MNVLKQKFKLVCPKCKCIRTVAYHSMRRTKIGERTGICRSCSRIGKIRENMRGNNHFAWKDENAGYMAKHTWARSNFQDTGQCEHCGDKDRRRQWANISDKYIRKREDWLRLCSPCHVKYDNQKRKLKIKATFN